MTAHLPEPQTSPAAQVGALAVFPLNRLSPSHQLLPQAWEMVPVALQTVLGRGPH